MSISLSLNVGNFLPKGWQYSEEEPKSATMQVCLPNEGRTATYDGAVFTLAVLNTGGQDVVFITLDDPAGLWFDGASSIIVRFDDELDVTFRAFSAREGKALVVIASAHLISLLKVSDIFEVRVTMADGIRLDIDADFGGPLRWIAA